MRTGRRRLVPALGALGLAAAIAAAVLFVPAGTDAARNRLTILGAQATTLDPAAAGDAGTSEVIAQVFETLTAIDANQRVQPALAESWQSQNGGKTVVFQLRPSLSFSDGSPIRASDVVASWLRVLDPKKPSSLASLLDPVKGAADYRAGKGAKADVAIAATGDRTVEVQLLHPATDLPAIASSQTLAVVPAGVDSNAGSFTPGSGFVASGAYVPVSVQSDGLTLQANSHYWAGKPAIDTISLKSDIGGKSSVSEFQAGNLDYTPISSNDASWITYDRTLGSSLRLVPSPTTEYYGFDTTKPPFDNVHVRRAFRMGIDWRHLITLAAPDVLTPATSMVPPGLPGRSNTDFGPVFDLTAAKSELAAAGYPNGQGFPLITLVTSGGGIDQGVVRQLHDNLGIDIRYETLDSQSYFDRVLSDPPAFWSMAWVADYPGADDFLGLLLGTGKENNYGRWSNAAFDAAIDRALSASDPAAIQQAFDAAQAIVRDEAPVIPDAYGIGYALSRKGLLGAEQNGQGFIRYAGLSWAPGQ